MSDSRRAAYLALMAWHEKGTFIWDSLERWKEKEKPSRSDLNFAYELACGTMRMQRYLDSLARSIVDKMPKKAKERMLLRLALYQKVFTPNIPIYAVVDTAVSLAKEYANDSFAKFLNAVLRKEIKEENITFAEKYSYTDFFVESLEKQYGKEVAHSLLDIENKPCPHHEVVYGNERYIQNLTQAELIQKQASKLPVAPKKILDLCAAPGGKTLHLHHLYPEATLIANEISSAKIATLEENMRRFNCPALITNMPGEAFTSPTPFDLILVDAPCSNSGVLYKCPEARWRIEKEEIEKLREMQINLLQHGATLLAPGGKIWYQTCSILAEENERLVEEICQRFKLCIDGEPLLQLPDAAGHEGGFSCSLLERVPTRKPGL